MKIIEKHKTKTVKRRGNHMKKQGLLMPGCLFDRSSTPLKRIEKALKNIGKALKIMEKQWTARDIQ